MSLVTKGIASVNMCGKIVTDGEIDSQPIPSGSWRKESDNDDDINHSTLKLYKYPCQMHSELFKRRRH